MNLDPPSSNSSDAIVYTDLLGSLIEIVRSISVSLFLHVFARILTGSDVDGSSYLVSTVGRMYSGVITGGGVDGITTSGSGAGSGTVFLNIAVAPSYPAQPVINVRATETGVGYPDRPTN